MGFDVMRPIVLRRLIGQRGIRNLSDHIAEMTHPQVAIGRNDANGDGIQTPFAEDAENFLFPALFGHQQHALLGFGEQHFISGHPRLALRNQVQIDIDSNSAAAAHLARR